MRRVVSKFSFFAKSHSTKHDVRDVDKSPAIDTLLQPLTAPYPSVDPSTPHPIDLPHTCLLYKTFLQGGHFSHKDHTIVRAPSFSASAFASAFITTVDGGRTMAMARGNGAFMVTELLERVIEEGSESERMIVKGWFSGKVINDLKNGEGKGRKVLLEKVAKLV
jgi:pumilio family protein 6